MKSHSSYLSVGNMVKGEADSGFPNLFQSHILQTLLGGGVVPAGEVGVAIAVLRGAPDLNPGDAPAALELVVGVAGGALLQLEQVPQVREGEVTFHILLLCQIIVESTVRPRVLFTCYDPWS